MIAFLRPVLKGKFKANPSRGTVKARMIVQYDEASAC
jgi:hypothetical protein